MFRPVAAVLILSLSAEGCTREDANNTPRKPIPLAPVGATSPGIGGPGGNSADTRATGTIANGEGAPSVGVTNPAGAPVIAPGVSPGSGTAGVHSGGRY